MSQEKTGEKIFVEYLQKESDETLKKLNKKGFNYTKYIDQILNQQEMNNNELLENMIEEEMIYELYESNFKDLRVLGKGSFGQVISGTRNNERYAIKCIKIEKENIEQQKNDIMNEYRLHTMLSDCKYVVRATSYETSKSGNYIFLLLEQCFMNLESLLNLQILDKDNQLVKMNESTFTKIANDLINAIYQLHKKNISIQDMKPENILVNYNFIFQIGDLGLSSMLSETQNLDRLIKGNYLYMSPERRELQQQIIGMVKGSTIQDLQQFKIEKNSFDEFMIQSDIFSLGLIFCQIILGSKFSLIFANYVQSYKNFDQFIKKVCEEISHYKNLNIQKIIQGFCQMQPKQRMKVDEALKLISSAYKSYKFDKLKHATISQNEQDFISKKFKEEIEFINTYQDQRILIASDKIIKEYLNQLQPNTFVFYKQLKQNIIQIKKQQTLQAFSIEGGSQAIFVKFDQFGIEDKQIFVSTLPQKKQSSIDQSQTTLKNQQSKITASSSKSSKTQLKCTLNCNPQKYEDDQYERKQEFVRKINEIMGKKEINYKFKKFEDILISNASTVFYKLLLFLIILFSLFEVACNILYFLEIDQFQKPIFNIIRIATTSLEVVMNTYLIDRLFLINQKEYTCVLRFISLFISSLFSSSSVFININTEFLLVQINNDSLLYVNPVLQVIIGFIAFIIFIRMFNRCFCKIQENDKSVIFYSYFSKNNLVKQQKQISIMN